MKQTPIKHSLRHKIFLRFTLLVGIALIAAGGFSVLIAQSTIKQRTLSDLLTLSSRQGQEITQLIDGHRTATRLLAQDTSVSGYFSNRIGTEQIRSHITAQRDTIPVLQSIVLAQPDGTIAVATNQSIEGTDLSTLQHIIQGKQRTYVGPLHILKGHKSYLISTPVYSPDKAQLGVLIAEFSLDPLFNILSEAKSLGRTGEYLLLEPEAHGGYCSNPDQSVFTNKDTLSSMLLLEETRRKTENEGRIDVSTSQGSASLLCSLAAGGREGIIYAEDGEQTPVIAAHHVLKGIGLGLIVKVAEDEIFRPVRLHLSVLVGTTCILLLLVTFVALRLSHDVVYPILNLRRSLQHLNTGNWSHERSVHTGDEIEVLDKEVSRLALRLKDAYASLEERVVERTQELDEQHAQDEALLESIGEGFLAINLEGKVITSNRTAEKMLLWDREQILNAHFSSILNLRTKDGRLLPPNAHHIERALREKATIRTSPSDTILCEKKDGTTFPIAITAMPFLRNMEIKGIVVTFRDITEEKRIDHMKSEFISLASHQLRTPLTAIGWYIELLQNEEKGLTGDQKSYVEQIIESHKRMVDLVNSLLNVSRIELGRVKIEPVSTTIDEIVDRTVEEFKHEIEKKKIEFVKRLPSNHEIFVDPDLVHIVLENLLSNAVKYTKEEGTIELAVLSDKEELQFSVHDTGMGIPQEQQNRIYEKLFRADNVLKTDTEGTGIGLYIAKYTTEAWGGRLWFDSAENKGTTFTFTVPVKMKKVQPENGRNLT